MTYHHCRLCDKVLEDDAWVPKAPKHEQLLATSVYHYECVNKYVDGLEQKLTPEKGFSAVEIEYLREILNERVRENLQEVEKYKERVRYDRARGTK